MEFPGCLTRPNVNCTFAGLDLAQTWQDLALWEAFLDAHEIRSLLEFGTWRGGMATFLAFQCHVRGAMFKTADHAGDLLQRRDVLATLGAELLCLDIHTESGVAHIAEILKGMPRPLLLFCDNGDKRGEVRKFTGCLRSGDYLAVHDWLSEIGPTDIPDHLIPVMEAEAESVSSLTRFFYVP